MGKKSSYLSDYIKGVVDKKYRTRSLAAEDLEIDESVLSRICSGKRPGVSESIVEKICDKLSLDKAEGVLKLFLTKHSKIKQFFTKPEKPISFKILASDPKNKAIVPKKILESYTPVPLISCDSLESGSIPIKQRVSEHALVASDWVDKDHNIQCCIVKGNSMDPTVPRGDIIAVDFDDKTLKNGKLYLLKWKNKIIVKRIFTQAGNLLLSSDNSDKDKPSIEICSLKKANSMKDSPILGHVIWSMGSQKC